MPADSVETHTLYAVWHPTSGWVRKAYGDYICALLRPHFFHNAGHAKALAKKAKAQLIVFDVVPVIRSWPAEED